VTRLYTGKGDDGTTGLLFGGRVAKDSARPRAVGAVDEAQAAIGVARSLCERDGELDGQLTQVCRDLWVLMAELATLPDNRDKLVDGQSRVSAAMVAAVEALVDDVGARFEPPANFVVPGQTTLAAQLDVARTVVRRAEREAVAAVGDGDAVAGDPGGSHVLPYLNRLSSLLWVQARWVEGEHLLSRDV
jgi:cob(I)alamin adenosyltransferase